MAVTKRYVAPRFWPVSVKAKKYVVSPVPGPHNKDECMPLGVVIRDLLGYARTMKEAKQILNKGMVRINGTARKEHGFPVGVMDIVDVEGEFYRVVPSKNGFEFVSTDEKDAKTRLVKILDKSHLKGKKIQLSFHDGSNMIADKDDHKTGDVVTVEEGKIRKSIKFEEGKTVIVMDGNNRGTVGKIESIDRKLKTVSVSRSDGTVLVPIRYVFVVGDDKPLVKVGA